MYSYWPCTKISCDNIIFIWQSALHYSPYQFWANVNRNYICSPDRKEKKWIFTVLQQIEGNGIVIVTLLLMTSGFWPRVRACALRAPVFLGSLPRQTGRCAPPPAHRSFAAYYSTPKNKQNLSNLGRPHTGPFFFPRDHRGNEIWGPLPLPHPSQLRWSFRQYCGVKMYRCDHTLRPNFFRFFLFCIAFGSFLFVILFFFFSRF